jgi:hypothetical protein
MVRWSARNRIKTNIFDDLMELVSSLEEKEREIKYEHLGLGLPVSVLKMHPDSRYGQTIQAQSTRTGCHRLRLTRYTR